MATKYAGNLPGEASSHKKLPTITHLYMCDYFPVTIKHGGCVRCARVCARAHV